MGDKGVGLLEHLGLTPGKVKQSLDEKWDQRLKALIEEYKDHIFWESRRRSGRMIQEWMKDSPTEMTEETMTKKLQESIKMAEVEVIRELVDKHL